MNNSQRGSLQFYLVVILLALIAFGLGVWDIMIEREGGGWLMQIIMPVVLIIVLAGLHSQAKQQRIAREEKFEREAAANGTANGTADDSTAHNASPDDGSMTNRLES